MITNGITIPDESVSKEYIPDPIGGYVYVVTTAVSISQERLDTFDKKLTAATEKVAQAQAELAELQAQKPEIDAAIFEMPTAPIDIASSTPKK